MPAGLARCCPLKLNGRWQLRGVSPPGCVRGQRLRWPFRLLRLRGSSVCITFSAMSGNGPLHQPSPTADHNALTFHPGSRLSVVEVMRTKHSVSSHGSATGSPPTPVRNNSDSAAPGVSPHSRGRTAVGGQPWADSRGRTAVGGQPWADIPAVLFPPVLFLCRPSLKFPHLFYRVFYWQNTKKAPLLSGGLSC